MANKNYDEYITVQQLDKKHDLKILGNTIQELNPPASKGDVGIKSRGKMDFLKKHRRYRHLYVDTFKR